MEHTYTPPPGPYGRRLCRAAGLVALGAAIHVLLPQGKSAPAPLTSPLKVARAEAQEEPKPGLLIEQTTIFAPFVGDLGHALTLRPPVARPVGTRGTTIFAASSPQPGSIGELLPAVELSPETPQPFDLDPERLPPLSPRTSTLEDIGASKLPDAADPVARTARIASALVGTPLPPMVADPRPAPIPIATVPALAEPPVASAPIEPLPASARVATVSSVSDETLVRRLLDEYAGAFERLDVSATKAVWPSVNDKALERAYGQIASQRLNLQGCGIIISGSTANARCQGSATYQPRIGKRAVVASREWTFDLSKKDAAWRIDALR